MKRRATSHRRQCHDAPVAAAPPHDPRDRGRVLRFGAAVLVAYLAVIGAELYFGKDMQRGTFTRLLSDDYDKRIYYHHGSFLPLGRTPYKDVFSEYPTVATLSFAAPFLVTRAAVRSYSVYSFVWSALMGVFFLGTLFLVVRARSQFGLSPWPALILLSPGVIYFAMMRFDVMVACLLCLSLDAFLKRRYGWAQVLLGVGTFTKVYPALAVPLYLARHHEQAADGTGPGIARPATIFIATAGVIAAASIAAFTWDGFLVPYRFQSRRPGQYFNLYWLLEALFRDHGWLGTSVWTGVGLAFFALQCAIVPIALLRRPRSDAEVIRLTVLGIFLFIVFAKIDSPQWILWYLPPALMVARSPRVLTLAAVVTVLNYLVFPAVYDAAGWNTWPYDTVVVARDVTSVALVVLLVREGDEVAPSP